MSESGKKVDMRSNPLYPDRIENNAVGVLLALASVVVAVICLVLIISKFSYTLHPENTPTYRPSNYPVVSQTDDVYGDSDNSDTGTALDDSDDTYTNDNTTDVQGPTMEDEMQQNVTESSTEYIIPDSASRYLDKSDLQNLTAEQLRIARNEIYARHGRLFDDEQLQAYFNSQPWYHGTIAPADFSESVLNDFERENTYTISDYEKEMGYR